MTTTQEPVTKSPPEVPTAKIQHIGLGSMGKRHIENNAHIGLHLIHECLRGRM